MNIKCGLVKLYVDNMPAIQFIKNPVFHSTMKHFELQSLYKRLNSKKKGRH